MKILKRRIIASTLGAAGVFGLGWGIGSSLLAPRADAQVMGGSVGGPAPATKAANSPAAARGANARAAAAAANGNLAPWTAPRSSPPTSAIGQGMWAEVVSSTSRWIVVQNQEGQQFPIAGDRIHQFLVRWPSLLADLTPGSLVEATGTQTSSASMMTDHIDVYEADAQNLVTPTMQGVGPAGPAGATAGFSGNYSFINYQSLNFGSLNWTEMPSSGTVNWTETPNIGVNSGMLHVVGHPTAVNPLTLAGFAPTPPTMTVAPAGGMTVTQVTLGTNSYAKKGDLVHVIAETALPRGLDVNQLVLYKKVRLSQFQP